MVNAFTGTFAAGRSIISAFIAIALVATLNVSAHAAGAAPRDTVYFAGAAFTSGVQAALQSMPVTDRVLGQSGLAIVNQQLLKALAAVPPKHISLEYSELASLDGSTNATVLAAAIDRETVLIERIGSQHKLLYEVAVQALFFDFRDKQVRFSIPITIQRIEVFDEQPTHEQVNAVASRALLSTETASVASALASALENVTLPSAASRRLRLVDVSVSEAVRERLPGFAQLVDAGVVGHEASKLISAQWHLGLLPYQSGQAVGGAMAARFADGRVYNLTIPTPDYRIVLRLDDFRSRILKETPAFRQQLFGAYFTIQVDEPLSGTAYFDQALRQGSTKTIPTTQGSVDDTSAYYETLLTGIASFAQAATDAASPWLPQQVDERAVSKQMKSLSELIALCR